MYESKDSSVFLALKSRLLTNRTVKSFRKQKSYFFSPLNLERVQVICIT